MGRSKLDVSGLYASIRASTVLAASLTWFVLAKTSDYWMPEQFQKTFSSIEVQVEEAKKDLETENNQEKFGEHWKKQHFKSAKPVQTAADASEVNTSLQESSAFFVPIPFWNRQRDGHILTPEDPLWKEVATLQADKQRQQGLQQVVYAETLKIFARKGAKSDFDAFKAFLQDGGSARISNFTVIPPLRGPPIYENLVLIVSRGGIHWRWRTLPGGVGEKLENIRKPYVFTHAYWVSGKVFLRASWKALKTMLDVKASRRPDRSISALENDGRSSRDAVDTPKLPDGPSITSLEASSSDLLRQAKSMQSVHSDLVARVTPGLALRQAQRAFQATFARDQLAAMARHQPRDSCQIRCTIDVIGRIATVRNDVRAVYIPARDVFVGPVIIDRTTVIPNLKEFGKDSTEKDRRTWKDELKRSDDEEERQLLAAFEQALQKKAAKLADEWNVLRDRKKLLDERMKSSETKTKAVEGRGTKDNLNTAPAGVELAGHTQTTEQETGRTMESQSRLGTSKTETEKQSAEEKTKPLGASEPAVDVQRELPDESKSVEEHRIVAKKRGSSAAKDSKKYVSQLSGKGSTSRKDDGRE